MAARLLDVWVNCPDRATAETIAEACVAERLAACANVFPPVFSVYRWKGAVERAEEVLLLLKTRAPLFDLVAAKVRAMHPYEVPGIVATELTAVDPAYADWLELETEGAALTP